VITIFSMPKPFVGHIGVIQRNAIQSWTRLQPACEIILLGDEQGIAEVASEYGVRHIGRIQRNEYGTPLVSSVFRTAESSANHTRLASVNADIILLDDFTQAVAALPYERYLAVGQRTNLRIEQPLDFNADWRTALSSDIARHGRVQCPAGMDYFIFTMGIWPDIPPFGIGRFTWDNWLIYEARRQRIPVVDTSAAITAVHQDHDYAHVNTAKTVLDDSPEIKLNRGLGEAGLGFSHRDAHWRLCRNPNGGGLGLRRNWSQYLKPFVRLARKARPRAYDIGTLKTPSLPDRRSAA
jgi:hypothetical protein